VFDKTPHRAILETETGNVASFHASLHPIVLRMPPGGEGGGGEALEIVMSDFATSGWAQISATSDKISGAISFSLKKKKKKTQRITRNYPRQFR
jgi:hypothetical protein